jgi:16S rRNA processing protein RimM
MNQNKKASTGNRRQAAVAPSGKVYYHRNEAVMIPDGYMAIGRIATAHGIQGDVRVELHTDFPERFAPQTVLYLGETLTPTTIEYARPHKQQMLVKFVDVETRDDAEALRAQWLFVPESDAVALEADTYWVHDIIGLQVQTETGEPLGAVSDVLFTGANEVYVVQGDNGNELLLPAIATVIQQVDLSAKCITVRLLPGMRDE